MTPLSHSIIAAACDCDAPLRATPEHPEPLHRSGCRAMLCVSCGQHWTAHPFATDGVLSCPDGRGVE